MSDDARRRKSPRTWRRFARARTCPVCSAGPGEPCVGPKGRRQSCHLERHTAAIANGAPVAYE